jgi:hypothetical protein
MSRRLTTGSAALPALVVKFHLELWVQNFQEKTLKNSKKIEKTA